MSAIGIDLGTTYSCVAVLRNERIEIVPNDEGDRLTPSCVSYSDIEVLTGKAAKEEIPFNFENTLYQIKRLIGRKFDDPNVQQDSKYWGFKIINQDNRLKIQVNYKHKAKTFYPEEISALILKHLKESAENYMGSKFTDAVITVPAYFNDSQRKATREAGRIAGLNVLQMINEPTAAAIAYGLDREKKDERHVLIFDLGGGTFDVTLITIKDRVFDVKATGGDTHLGGEDLDDRMVKHFVEEFNEQNKVDISENKRAMSRLRIQCEAAKRKLSVNMIAKVQVDGFHNGKDYKTTISRAKFEELNYDYFEQMLEAVDVTLSDAKFNKEKVDEVVLVGGSTRIPKLRNMIQEYFNGKELYKTINPDEAVAHGAAALAVDLSTDASAKIKEFTLYDIVPLPLGINVVGDIMSVVVNKNSKIPSKHYKTVTTVADNQTVISFSVYQGERTSTMHNKHLGSFSLSGISPAPRRVPRIDVCFDIDSSSILTVTAKDKITGNKNNLQLEAAKLKLTMEEIELMVQEAEKYKLDDIELGNIADMRINLETLVFNAEESAIFLDSQGNLNKEDKCILLNKCESVSHWLNKNKNASKETLFQQQIEFQNCCHPIFIRICRDKQIADGIASENKKIEFNQIRIEQDKVSVKSEYEVKIQQLKNIQQSVSNKLSDEGKNLQSDVKKYVGRIRHFVEDYPYSEMLSSEERKMLLEQYSEALWIENYRNVTSIEIREKLQQIIEVCEPIFERLLQNAVKRFSEPERKESLSERKIRPETPKRPNKSTRHIQYHEPKREDIHQDKKSMSAENRNRQIVGNGQSQYKSKISSLPNSPKPSNIGNTKRNATPVLNKNNYSEKLHQEQSTATNRQQLPSRIKNQNQSDLSNYTVITPEGQNFSVQGKQMPKVRHKPAATPAPLRNDADYDKKRNRQDLRSLVSIIEGMFEQYDTADRQKLCVKCNDTKNWLKNKNPKEYTEKWNKLHKDWQIVVKKYSEPRPSSGWKK
uniref:heat shock cognate 71 kDa protein-like n=1 Tax=Styela clava TaxID=7725 RepID=UPI00193A85CE|nr:heat shock cognate 71 kDa protein-like [Styela clava]